MRPPAPGLEPETVSGIVPRVTVASTGPGGTAMGTIGADLAEQVLGDGVLAADPLPALARLRAEAPVAPHRPTGAWILSRHADVLAASRDRSEEHTSELQSRENLVCRLLLEKKKKTKPDKITHHARQRHHQSI